MINARRQTGMMLPEWVFNHTISVDQSQWEFVPYNIALPTELPDVLREHGCLLQQSGKGATHRGSSFFLTKDQLHNLWLATKFELPAPKHGSGANGKLVKRDYAVGALKFFCKDVDPDSDDFQTMLQALLG